MKISKIGEILLQNPIFYMTSRLWRYSEGNRKNVILYLVLATISNVINLAEPLILAYVINVIATQGVTDQNIHRLLLCMLLYLARTCASWSFHGPSRVIENANAFLARANYKKYLLDGVKELPMEWHSERHSGDTIDRIGKGGDAIYNFASSSFELINLFVMLIGSYVVLASFYRPSLFILLIGILGAATIVVKFDRVLIVRYRHLSRTENIIAEKIFDMISNIRTVIILRIEKLLAESVFRKIMEPFKFYNQTNKTNEFKWFWVSLCSASMKILILGSYIYLHWRDNTPLLVAPIYILYSYVQNINETFYSFAGLYGNVVKQSARVANAEELASEFIDKKKIEPGNLANGWQKLEIRYLNFAYKTDDDKVVHLDNIHMTINRGERIAFIGESGAGKSTLLQVMRDIYHPSSVELILDGRKLPHGFRSIRDSIALVPQDPDIFKTTILDNVTSTVEHEMTYVRKFTDMARFSEVADNLPRGFSSSINERGVNLSGGQKQRLALARGLMASDNKSILLLDEPTSSVDIENEIKIYEMIFSEFKSKTIISALQKLHLLPMFDVIYFFDDGKILASGTFKKLLASCQRFQEIWQEYNREFMK